MKLTTKEFIRRAKSIHGNKYDYSLTNYINISTKVKIICPIHGIFEQAAKSHLNGHGCSKCYFESRKKLWTKERFIKKANFVHNNFYDYSLVDFKNLKTKVKIICPVHGIFEQVPRNHLNGHGCNKCAIEKNHQNSKKTTEEFIERAKQIHNNKYDYSLVDYKGLNFKVKIICPIHGIFEQDPNSHLRGEGCKKCGKISANNKHRIPVEEFIRRAKLIHGNKYDYSLVSYKSLEDKVKIICPVHGIFKQIAGNHLRYHGCPKCKSSIGETKIRTFLELHNIFFEEQKTFPDCKYKKELYFDFYLPNNNLIIEYDGEQHFKPIDFSHSNNLEDAKNRFENSKIRDKIKNDYCKNNNINLLRISYKDDIFEKLNFLDQK